jgi:hypothetical protein
MGRWGVGIQDDEGGNKTFVLLNQETKNSTPQRYIMGYKS